jgi:prepilin-type N-terminal cleavage/methylation domain-containing protein
MPMIVPKQEDIMPIKAVYKSGMRLGFTIIELLIVITIIGILTGLLLPAVQAARETARKTQCQNNIRQLALALQGYHTCCRAFPPAINLPAGEIEATTTKWKENWVITILPYMDQKPLHDQFDLSKPISDPANRIPRGQKLPFMLCPSDTGSDVLYGNAIEGDNWARGNYAANGSIAENELGTLTPPPQGVPQGYAQNGINWPLPWVRGVMGSNASLKSDDIKDGLSNTILLAEVRIGVNSVDRRGTWAMGSAGASSLFGHGVGKKVGPNVDFPDNLLGAAAIQTAAGGPDELMSEGMPCWDGDGSTKATMRSQHEGGVFTGFCDGSVHWLNNHIDHGDNPDIPGTEQAKRSKTPNPNPPTANDYHVWERLNCSADGFPVDGAAF